MHSQRHWHKHTNRQAQRHTSTAADSAAAPAAVAAAATAAVAAAHGPTDSAGTPYFTSLRTNMGKPTKLGAIMQNHNKKTPE